MRRFFVMALLALMGLGGAVMGRAAALVIAPPPRTQLVNQSELVVVGRVVALEPKDVAAPSFPKGANVNYRIAVVSVTDVIKGKKDVKNLRVGFIVFQPVQPGKGPIRPIRRPGGPNFMAGQDGIFFLNKHFQESFYTAPMYFNFISSQTPNFEKEVKITRLTVDIGNNPVPRLKSKDADERFLAASILIEKYRPFGRQLKIEPIDAQESKLILTALLDSDWKQVGRLTPYTMFLRLGLTDKDGWQPPRGPNLRIEDFHKAAQDWLRKNADTYRIQRVVTAPFGPGPGGPIRPGGPVRPGVVPQPKPPVRN